MKNVNKVAVLGPKGTFTEIAARRVFSSIEVIYCDSVSDVFDAVDNGIEFGVVAIENSLEGSVNTTMDCLIEYNMKIHGEVILDINLCLLAPSETRKEDIKVLISHPHALAQCKKFLRRNYPDARLQRHESTAAAMKELSELSSGEYAAIGPKEAADLYNLEILSTNIEDAPSQTRFIVISRKESGGDKTSIIFALKDEPGSLYHILGDFAERNINLTKIESRPSRRKLGEYFFFVDLKGSLSDERVKDALDAIKEKTTFLKILGSYQQA
ncbi:MAG: prephenate dehydratase [Candidatus Altiarchaeota archaeon]|nr:prephenate dehydratase [Candidatus Altiarchaeota archaeon]